MRNVPKYIDLNTLDEKSQPKKHFLLLLFSLAFCLFKIKREKGGKKGIYRNVFNDKYPG